MDDEKQAASNEYFRNRYLINGEKHREYYHEYYKNHREEMLLKTKERNKKSQGTGNKVGRPRKNAKKKIPVVYLDDITPPQPSPNNDFGDKNDNTVVAVQ